MRSCPLCLLVDKVYILHLLPAVSHITAHLNDVHPIVSTSLSLSINTALLIHHAPFRIFTFEAICFFFTSFPIIFSYELLGVFSIVLWLCHIRSPQSAHIYGTIQAFHLYPLLYCPDQGNKSLGIQTLN